MKFSHTDIKQKTYIVAYFTKQYICQNIWVKHMESKLIIERFGPIEKVNLLLKNVNVFIGPQSSGKSSIAKLFTIFKSPAKYFMQDITFDVPPTLVEHNFTKEKFENVLEEFNIKSFLKENSKISYESQVHSLSYSNGKFLYIRKLAERINKYERLLEDIENNKPSLVNEIIELSDSFFLFGLNVERSIYGKLKDDEFLCKEDFNLVADSIFHNALNILQITDFKLSKDPSIYIPAERIITGILKDSVMNLMLNNVPIPKHILSFGAELEKLKTSEIDLSILKPNLKYKNVDGKSLIFFSENESIDLTESASGIQSILPILQISESRKNNEHRSLVIEEPELNLFPIAQYNLIKALESKRNDPGIANIEDFGTIHTYTTHSPYILSSLNNLLFAKKVINTLTERELSKTKNTEKYSVIKEKNTSLVEKIIEQNISPRSFTAYQISDGGAISIFDSETGLIQDNFIDDSSDIIDDDFEKLMDLIK